MVMGEQPDAGPFETKTRAMQLFESGKLIPPIIVDKGPVMENIYMDDEVNIDMIPTPKWHDDDGGRYIGTGSYTITKD